MKKLLLVLFFPLLVSVGHFGVAQAQYQLESDEEAAALSSDQSKAVLFGQGITIDLKEIEYMHGDQSAAKWADASKLLPEIMPDIFASKNKRELKDILYEIGWAKVQYRNLYECTAYNVAGRILEEGHVEALASGPAQLEFIKGELQEKADTQKQNFAYVVVGQWIRDNTWQKNVDSYNAQKRDKPMSVYMFIHPDKLHRYAQALHMLDVLVRRSPEVIEQDLGSYGTWPATQPECFKGKQVEFEDSLFKGNARDGLED